MQTFDNSIALRDATAAQLRQALALATTDDLTGKRLTSDQDIHRFLVEQTGHLEHETFSVIWLDHRLSVIAVENKMFRGTHDTVSVWPREVLKSALAHNAASCVISHNHPAGRALPSDADKSLTVRLMMALKLIDVTLIDHVIVGARGATYSLREKGDLNEKLAIEFMTLMTKTA
jgi:DNA repair protein RadC